MSDLTDAGHDQVENAQIGLVDVKGLAVNGKEVDLLLSVEGVKLAFDTFVDLADIDRIFTVSVDVLGDEQRWVP